MTLIEFWLESEFSLKGIPAQTSFGLLDLSHLNLIGWLNEGITFVFIVELTLRFSAASSKRAFFSEFWLDIVATIPMFRIFRSARALRLLRLIRLLRLLGIFARLSTHYPSIFRNSAADFIIVSGMLVIAVLFGTVAITHFENESSVKRGSTGSAESQPMADAAEPKTILNLAANENAPGDDIAQNEFTLQSSFWYSIYTLLAGEPIPGPPKTTSSRIVTLFLMFAGMTIFAIFAGTVSAFMVDRMRREGRVVEWDALSDHIVICGWTQKTKIIIDEYRASQSSRKVPIVVITELDTESFDQDVKSMPGVMFVHDDFTRVSALRRAGIDRAKTCLVLTDTTGGRSQQDADARTILAALTVEKINHEVYTCAELVNRNYASHLEAGNVNDFVVTSEYGAHVLAQAAMKRGLANVVSELLTYDQGNEFYRVEIPASWVGKSFDEKLVELRTQHDSILVAVHSANQPPNINPTEYMFETSDEVVLISRQRPKLT